MSEAKKKVGVGPFGDTPDSGTTPNQAKASPFSNSSANPPVSSGISMVVGGIDQGANPNKPSTAPFFDPAYDEVATDLKDYADQAAKSAADAATSAEQAKKSAESAKDSAESALDSASDANQSAKKAAESAAAAATSAAEAEASALRAEIAAQNVNAEQFFAKGQILNTATNWTTFIVDSGTSLIPDGQFREAITLYMEVKRTTDVDSFNPQLLTYFATYMFDVHFVQGVWYIGQVFQTILAGAGDPMFEVEIETSGTIGILKYRIVALPSDGYTGIFRMRANSYKY